MTSAELVTLPEQVVKESISACKAPPVKESSAVISPVELSLVGKQTTSAPDSYEDVDVMCQKIPYNQKVEQDLRWELSSCTKGDDGKINKAIDIQIPELSLEEILTGSSEVTAQIIVDLFRVVDVRDVKRFYAGIVIIKHMKIESGMLSLRMVLMTNQ